MNRAAGKLQGHRQSHLSYGALIRTSSEQETGRGIQGGGGGGVRRENGGGVCVCRGVSSVAGESSEPELGSITAVWSSGKGQAEAGVINNSNYVDTSALFLTGAWDFSFKAEAATS